MGKVKDNNFARVLEKTEEIGEPEAGNRDTMTHHKMVSVAGWPFWRGKRKDETEILVGEG